MSDARVCERVTRTHARTFSLASYFLPPRKRRAAFAVYAFCRVADDIVDAALEQTAQQQDTAARQLDDYRARLGRALAGASDDAVMREAAWAVHEFGVPDTVLYELVDGVARDLNPTQYETWGELETYCHGVASTVGIMCAHIFGIANDTTNRSRALGYARTLGVAMQLTNVLRDVGEDARRGRCYIPRADLRGFGIETEEILENPQLSRDARWQQLMMFEITRARRLYADAYPGIAMLSPDAQRCAAACAIGYASILGAIEHIAYDSMHHRARVGIGGKLAVLWRAWRYDGSARFAVPTAFAS